MSICATTSGHHLREGRTPERFLFVRMGDYAVTPAVPRFVSVAKKVIASENVAVLCWPYIKSSFVSSADVRLIEHSARINGGWSSKVIKTLTWWVKIFRELHRGRYRCVQVSDVISLVPCLLARPILGYSLIQDIRDPVRVSKSEQALARLILGSIEALGSLVANRVIIVEESRRRFLPRSVRDDEKVVVVRNLPDADELKEEELRFPASESIRINFSGYLSATRGCGMLCSAVLSSDYLVLDVVGDTTDRNVMQALRQGGARIRVHGRVSRERNLELMTAAHLVALLYDPRIEANRVAAPNKFYEAMMMGRPCLTCSGTPMAETVEKWNCGYVVPYGDVGALMGVVESVRAQPSEWLAKACNARRLYEEHFRWEDEAKRLERTYKELLGITRLTGAVV